MKKILIGIVIGTVAVGIFSVGAFAGKFEISARAGFTTVGMEDVNNLFDQGKDMLTLYGYTILKESRITSGYPVEIEGLYAFSPSIKAGISMGYIFLPKAEISFSHPTWGITGNFEILPSVIPIMLGGKYSVSIMKNLNLGGSLFAGIALGYSSYKGEMKGGFITPTTYDISMNGSAFCGEIAGECEYYILPQFCITSSFGYRLANIPQMVVSDDVDLNGDGTPDVKKGEVMEDTTGKPLPFDFSGLAITVGAKFIF